MQNKNVLQEKEGANWLIYLKKNTTKPKTLCYKTLLSWK